MSARTAELPALLLRSCRVGRIDLDEPAFDCSLMQVAGEVGLPGSTLHSWNGRGAVDLSGARIAQLRCIAASMTCGDGPALRADRLETRGDAQMEGLVADGAGQTASVGGAVRLAGAMIDGIVNLRGAQLRCRGGSALVTDGARIGDRLYLDPGIHCYRAVQVRRGTSPQHDGRRPIRLHRRNRRQRSRVPSPPWHVDGFTYSGTPVVEPEEGKDRDAWLRILRESTPDYAAQPYQHLAAVYRAAGHDSDVRAILIAQRHNQVARSEMSRSDRH